MSRSTLPVPYCKEVFSNLPSSEAIVRLILSSAGFVGTGAFVFGVGTGNRRIVMLHLEEVEGQIRLRQEAEEQLRVLVESSPAAILTVDSKGEILLANQAAQEILAPGQGELKSQPIQKYPLGVADRCPLKAISRFQDNHAVFLSNGQTANHSLLEYGLRRTTHTRETGWQRSSSISPKILFIAKTQGWIYLLKNARILA